jgi:hypothetical protein
MCIDLNDDVIFFSRSVSYGPYDAIPPCLIHPRRPKHCRLHDCYRLVISACLSFCKLYTQLSRLRKPAVGEEAQNGEWCGVWIEWKAPRETSLLTHLL